MPPCQAIRVFVEAVLRYGLPVNFVCALMKPGKGADAKVHELLHVSGEPLPALLLMSDGVYC
jgi:V-ATPase subunit C